MIPAAAATYTAP